ncbi:MAG: hypothetical protein AAFX58_05665 [Pseudomonadota bacterium]
MTDASQTLPRTARGERPQYFQDPATDRLLAIVMTLAGELSVTRARLDALERVLATGGTIDREAVANYAPDAAAAAARDADREAYVRRIMRAVEMELAELQDGKTTDFDTVYESLL